jgi:hypothetical protein
VAIGTEQIERIVTKIVDAALLIQLRYLGQLEQRRAPVFVALPSDRPGSK